MVELMEQDNYPDLKEQVEGTIFPREEDTVVNFLIDEYVFKTHLSIMAASSSVFASMFEEDKAEVTNGLIYNLVDCEPVIFMDMLLFLYDGNIPDLTTTRALSLYLFSNSYGIHKLSEFCLKFIASNISIDTFGDILLLAVTYDLKDLYDATIEYFATNPDVFTPEKFDSFCDEYPGVVLDMIIDSFGRFYLEK